MFGLVEMMVTGLICFLLSFAAVAILIQTIHIRKRKGSRERESLLSSARSARRAKAKIRIQKSTKVPTKHLRSQSIGIESPQKQVYKYPYQQHYRRKSSPNISKINLPKNTNTLVNISPNMKCEKLFSLHQVQPVTTPNASPTIELNKRNIGDPAGYITGTKNIGIKTKHLHLHESKELANEKLIKSLHKSEKEMETMFGLENLNNNNDLYEKRIYITTEK